MFGSIIGAASGLFGGGGSGSSSSTTTGMPKWLTDYYKGAIGDAQDLYQNGSWTDNVGPSPYWGVSEDLAGQYFGGGFENLVNDSNAVRNMLYGRMGGGSGGGSTPAGGNSFGWMGQTSPDGTISYNGGIGGESSTPAGGSGNPSSPMLTGLPGFNNTGNFNTYGPFATNTGNPSYAGILGQAYNDFSNQNHYNPMMNYNGQGQGFGSGNVNSNNSNIANGNFQSGSMQAGNSYKPSDFQYGQSFQANTSMPGASQLGSLNFQKDFSTYGLENHLNPSANGNPYLYSVIGNVTSDINRNLKENILPSIGRDAQGAGQFGGSRQGIAEGIAARGAAEEAAQQASNIRFQDYTNANNRAIQAGSTLGNLDLGSQGQANNRAGTTASYNLGGANLANSAANQGFNNALAGWNANEAQRQYNNNFGQSDNQFGATFGEGQRQFNNTFGEGMRQFDNSFLEGMRQYNTDTGFNQANTQYVNNMNNGVNNFYKTMDGYNALLDATMAGNQFDFGSGMAMNNFGLSNKMFDFNSGLANDQFVMDGLTGVNNNYFDQIANVANLGNNQYNYDMMQAMSPYDQLGWYMSMLGGVPTETKQSSNTSSGGDGGGLFGAIGSLF